ncbi:MAG TPA: PQQ-binding-like beta-propeller repeat protein [Vicinamibacterales bacterium]|nr:PQQ-binding-like beta-propeller repeat protein [Vicinamibacterales bacterium]
MLPKFQMRWFAALPIVLALTAGVGANDWPHWRGPAASGVAASSPLPSTWSDTENVAWRAALAGAGVSSPIVSGSRVFVTSQIGDGRRQDGRHPTLTQGGEPSAAGESTLARRVKRADVTFVVEAFDRATGKRAWIHEMAAEGDLPPVHDKHNLASASPVTDGERVYAWYGTGQIAAIDTAGKRVWSKHLGKEYGPFDINWGHASSPVLFQDTLILLCYHTPASYLLAVDKRSGAVKWKVDKPAGVESYSSPIVVDGPGGPELIVNSSTGVESFDPATGKSLWTYPEVNRFPIPVAMVDGSMLYVSRGYRSSPYMAIRLGGRGDITNTHVAWRVPTGGPYVSSLVHYQGVIYMSTDNGILSAVDATNGQRLWQERVGGTFSASPIAGDGKVFFVSEGGETIVVKAGRTFEVISRNKLEGHFVASPAAGGGRIFLRADDRIYAVGK